MLTEVDLVACVRAALTGVGRVTEVKMFGGLGFLLNGKLLAGASPRGLLLRVGSERAAEALRQGGARPMVMRGRTMADYVYVDPPALDVDSVSFGLQLAIPYVQALPPKPPKAVRPRKAATPSKAGASASLARPRNAQGSPRAVPLAKSRHRRASSARPGRRAPQRTRGRRAR